MSATATTTRTTPAPASRDVLDALPRRAQQILLNAGLNTDEAVAAADPFSLAALPGMGRSSLAQVLTAYINFDRPQPLDPSEAADLVAGAARRAFSKMKNAAGPRPPRPGGNPRGKNDSHVRVQMSWRTEIVEQVDTAVLAHAEAYSQARLARDAARRAAGDTVPWMAYTLTRSGLVAGAVQYALDHVDAWIDNGEVVHHDGTGPADRSQMTVYLDPSLYERLLNAHAHWAPLWAQRVGAETGTGTKKRPKALSLSRFAAAAFEHALPKVTEWVADAPNDRRNERTR